MPARLQRKLAVGEVDDPLELEADRVADHVMRMQDPSIAVTPASPTLSRTCAACETDEQLQRKRSGGDGPGPVAVPAVVHQVLGSAGEPLDAAARAYFEPRFARDFGQVRVHADAQAAASANAVRARAYAVGPDIVFAAGQYAPATHGGRRLLAHELTHVAQQDGGAPRLFRQPQPAGSGWALKAPEPRSLHGSVDAGGLEPGELDLEIKLIREWLDEHREQTPQADHLRAELPRLESAAQIGKRPFEIRFSTAWSQAEAALRKEVRERDSGGSVRRGLMDVDHLAVEPEAVWTHGLAGALFLARERPLVEKWAQEVASKSYSKRYEAAKYGSIYGMDRDSRQREDTAIWARGEAFGLFLESEKASVLRIPAASIGAAASLRERLRRVDPKGPQAAKLIDDIHDFTSNPGVVLLGEGVEKLLGPYGYAYNGDVDAGQVAHAINQAYAKSLEPNQIRKAADTPLNVRWDECMRRRNLQENNLERAEYDPLCFQSVEEFEQELIRRAQEFKTRYEACGHSKPSHFRCRDAVSAEYFPAGHARQDAIRRWAQGQLEIYEGVVQGGVVSQTGFHFAYDVLGWSTERSAAFGGALSTGTSLGAAAFQRRAVLQKPPSNPPPPPTATTEVVGKPEPMPKPDAPVAKVAQKPAVKAPVDPLAGSVQRPVDVTQGRAYPPQATPAAAIHRAKLEVEQAQRSYDSLRAQASEAEASAKRIRSTVRAVERKGGQPTQEQRDTLENKARLAKARDEAFAKLKQAKENLRTLQPAEGGTRKHGQAGLAEEPKYLAELRAQGVQAELTAKNTPVIDAAAVGKRELHSVKSVVPSEGSEVAVRAAEAGSPTQLATRVSKHITTALVDRRSDKWSRLRNRWNNTMRETHADAFGYELPKNPDDISFVVDVRVVTAKPPSTKVQQDVEAAVAAWLKRYERVPPGFSWRIIYVSD